MPHNAIDKIIRILDRIAEWFDNKSAKWSHQMGHEIPPDVIERRISRTQRGLKRW